VDEILGVEKEFPVPNEELPVNAEYQFIVPADAVAPNVTVPVPQRELGVIPLIVGIERPIPVNEIVGELLSTLVTVIVAIWLPLAAGVKVTVNVAIPPSPIIVVEERPETTNCELFEVTVTPLAVAFVFVIV
jgi:hypothetical protein